MIESKVIEKFMEENGLEPYDAFDVDGEFKQCNPLYFNEDLELRSIEFDSRDLDFFGGKEYLYRLLTGKDHVTHKRTEDNNLETVVKKKTNLICTVSVKEYAISDEELDYLEKGLFRSFESFEEAKREALQFLKKEAIESMKELTYIINFIDE